MDIFTKKELYYQNPKLCLHCNTALLYEVAYKRKYCSFSCSVKDRDGEAQSSLRKNKLENLLQDIPEAYYWIGYLIADGYICHRRYDISLPAAKQDLNQLEKYASFIQAESILESKIKKTYFKGKEYQGQQECRVKCGSANAVRKIISKFGFKTNKTSTPLDLPKDIPDDLFLALFIGFIDGDGTIRKYHSKHYGIRIMVHQGQLPFLIYCEKKVKQILNWKSTHRTKTFINSKINGRGYAEVTFDTAIVKALKIKISELNIPVLERKWDKIKG